MKFFKPNFANKSASAAAASIGGKSATSSGAPPAGEDSPTVAADHQHRQLLQQPPTAPSTPAPAPVVDFADGGAADAAAAQAATATTFTIVKLEEDGAQHQSQWLLAASAPAAALSSQPHQQQQHRKRRPSLSIVDLDEGVNADTEMSDWECAAVAAAAPVAAGSGGGSTLFQRKRSSGQQQQRCQGRRATPCGGLRGMRMCDLIYWCPKDQPPPKWRQESMQQQQQQLQNPAKTDDAAADQQSSPPHQPRHPADATVKPEQSGGGGSGAPRPVPQVMLDSRGNIVLNEESLVIREAAQAAVEDVREDCTELRATYRSFRSAGATRGRQWSSKETLRFYKALSTIGTDFSYMASLFKGRSREELKRKYKREEKANPHLIDQMLRKRKPYDLSMFDPSSDSDDPDGASVADSSRGKAATSGKSAKPSDIVMEGLKRHLESQQKADGKRKQQEQQTVSVIIC